MQQEFERHILEETVRTDRAATAISLACIVHCLALPLVASALPFVAVVAEAEWVHWVLAILALLASLSVTYSSKSARVPSFLIPSSAGIALLVFGLFAEHAGFDETMPTVIGGSLLAAAHMYRLFRHK